MQVEREFSLSVSLTKEVSAVGHMIRLIHAHKRGRTKRSSLYRALGSGTKRRRKPSDMRRGGNATTRRNKQ